MGNCTPFSLRAPFLTSFVCGLSPPGRLGAMVTVTLKLGISILNGGNILVQQVRPSTCFTCVTSQLPSVTDCFCLAAENAGLPEGKKRCGIFQKSVWADDVLQVVKPLGFLLSQKDAVILIEKLIQTAYCRHQCRENLIRDQFVFVFFQCPGLECFRKAKQSRRSGHGD